MCCFGPRPSRSSPAALVYHSTVKTALSSATPVEKHVRLDPPRTPPIKHVDKLQLMKGGKKTPYLLFRLAPAAIKKTKKGSLRDEVCVRPRGHVSLKWGQNCLTSAVVDVTHAEHRLRSAPSRTAVLNTLRPPPARATHRRLMEMTSNCTVLDEQDPVRPFKIKRRPTVHRQVRVWPKYVHVTYARCFFSSCFPSSPRRSDTKNVIYAQCSVRVATKLRP